MTLQNERALQLYKEAQTDLESALSMFADHQTPLSWLESVKNAPCTSWDYPKLVWSQVSWQYLREVQTLKSPLLHTRTFLLARISHLLFLQGRAWTVSELCISTLHTMAREINMLKVQIHLPLTLLPFFVSSFSYSLLFAFPCPILSFPLSSSSFLPPPIHI